MYTQTTKSRTPNQTHTWHRRKQVSFHEEVLNSMGNHAEHSLKTVLNSKVEIMEALRFQNASSSSAMQSQQSMLSRLSARLDKDHDEVQHQKLTEEQKQHLILASLRFSNMRLRRDTIPLTYQATFEWIFSERHKFRSWLQHEGGIFWVSGKAGSGKSTLMKFISSHALTRHLLGSWAAPLKLHVLDFFFWYTGSDLQKSQEGLLRTIIHDILDNCKDLIPRVVPHRWSAPDSFFREPDSWSRVELIQVLESIAMLRGLGFKFCIFLDGLDEYSGNHQDLITDLRALSSNKCIKLCVSSRPWNVFVNAFGSLDGVIHLEELTANDIHAYVSGHLTQAGGSKSETDIADLVSEVVLKSQSVFFWVFLVTRSLKEGLEEGDSIRILRRRLSEIPSDLEIFSQSLLARLNRTYKLETSQVLKLAMITIGRSAAGDNLDNWLDFWMLTNFDFYDTSFATSMHPRSYNDHQTVQMKNDTRAFINASCRDFLSITTNGRTVAFLHRTVYDFLSGSTIQAMLDGQVPPIFHDPQVLLHIRLARCKILRPLGDRQQPFCYGASEPSNTLMREEDYHFPDSGAMAHAFEEAMIYVLQSCAWFHKQNSNPICKLTRQCTQIVHFLLANHRHRWMAACPLAEATFGFWKNRKGNIHAQPQERSLNPPQ